MYISFHFFRRKRIGVLASEHWKNKYPKFNTPQAKTELKQFIEKISGECFLPEAGFFCRWHRRARENVFQRAEEV